MTDFYEEQKAEEFLQERVEQIIGTMELLEIDVDRLTAYSADDLSAMADAAVALKLYVEMFGNMDNRPLYD